MAQTSQIINVASNLLWVLIQNNARYAFSASRIGESPSAPAPTCFGALEVYVGNPGFSDANVNR